MVFSRTMGFYRLAKGDWEKLQQLSQNYESKSNSNLLNDDEDNRNDYKYCIDMINCYIEGINAWFAHPQCKYSVELNKLLKYKPQFWTAIDVMAVWRLLGFIMSYGWQSKILKTLMIQSVGYENAKWMTLESHELAPPQCPYNDCKVKPNGSHIFYTKQSKEENEKLENSGNFEVNQFYQSLKNLGTVPSDQPIAKGSNVSIGVDNAIGSNAWSVGPQYTDTGHPIMG